MLRTSRSIQQGHMIPYYSTADMPVPSIADFGLLSYYQSTDALYTSSARSTLATADNDAVGSWTDDQAANHLIEGVAASFQTGIINGLPIVRFDGSTNYLQSTSNIGITGANPWTVICCFHSNSNTTNATIWSLGTYGTAYHIFALQQNSTSSTLYANTWGGPTSIGDSSVNFASGFHIVTVKFDGTNLVCYVDGAQKSTSTGYSSLNLTNDKFRLGGFPGGYDGQYSYIDVQSVYIASRALSDGDRQGIEGVIATNTGITLS